MENHLALKKIMVCLDLTEMDESLIRFTSYISRKMDSDRIYFVHIAPSLDMPEEIRKSYPDLFAPLDERLKREIEHSVKEFFKAPNNCTVDIEVREGNPSDGILKTAEQKDIDLLIMGRKVGFQGGGVLPEKLAKMTRRSVLLVPEILPKVMDKILVPVDFSAHSLIALKQALKIKQISDIAVEVNCVNIFRLPLGWSKTGKTEEEFIEIMKGHAQNDFNKFIRKLEKEDRNIHCSFILDKDNNPSHKIYRQAVKEQTDLIIMGSKGTTAAASVLLGSTAEKIATYDKNIPLLIVKDKDENIGFLQALLKI